MRYWLYHSVPVHPIPLPPRRLFCAAAFQRQFFTLNVEIVGRGDLHQMRNNTFAQHQLTRSGFIGGQRRIVASGKYLRTARADLPPWVATTISGASSFSAVYCTAADRFSDAQFAAVVVEVQTAGHHAVSTFADGGHDGHRFQRIFTFADSPDSMTASVPSRMVSPRRLLQRGLTWVLIMESSICGSDNHFTCADTFLDHLLREDHLFNRDFNTQCRHAQP